MDRWMDDLVLSGVHEPLNHSIFKPLNCLLCEMVHFLSFAPSRWLNIVFIVLLLNILHMSVLSFQLE